MQDGAGQGGRAQAAAPVDVADPPVDRWLRLGIVVLMLAVMGIGAVGVRL